MLNHISVDNPVAWSIKTLCFYCNRIVHVLYVPLILSISGKLELNSKQELKL